MKQRELALALKVVDIVALVCSLGVLIFLSNNIEPLTLPDGNAGSALRHGALPFTILASIPLIIIAIQAWKLFSELARDNSFTSANARRFRTIGLMAFSEAGLFMLATLAIALFGVMNLGALAALMVVVIACGALAVISLALSHIVAKASELQAENDLTV